MKARIKQRWENDETMNNPEIKDVARQQDEEIVIDLREVFFTLLHGWKIIFLCFLVGAVAFGIFHTLFVKPSYKAYTELYITSTDSVISLQDLHASIKDK